MEVPSVCYNSLGNCFGVGLGCWELYHGQRTVLAWLGGGNEEGKSGTADCKDAWKSCRRPK